MEDLRHEQQLIYTAINEKYIPSTIMSLRKINLEKAYGIWYAQMACMTAQQNRIIVCIVPLEPWHSVDSTAPLNQLKWIGFQARETNDQALLNQLRGGVQSCPVRPPVSELSTQILRKVDFKVVVKGDLAWTYLSDQLPSLRIDLLKEKESADYRPQGTLEQCLDTFQACLAFQLQP
jgi:hypothetical protein